jgi:hypothetical protein
VIARRFSFVLVAGLTLSSCGLARPEGSAPGSSAAKTNAARAPQLVVEGVPDASKLVEAVETDVPGELTVRVPSAWIGRQTLAPGHAVFTSRDGALTLAITDAGPAPATDQTALTWASRKWLNVTKPSIGAFAPTKLGRSGLPAERAEGTALVGGQPSHVVYVRLRRRTEPGEVSVLITLFVRDDANADERARAESVVRSIGTR